MAVWRKYFDPRAIYFPVLFLCSVLSIWVRNGFPIHADGNAGLDDLLFIRLATYLSSGNWLGPYNETTLAKGMFYSIFIAFAHTTGVPLKTTEQIAYLAVCGPTAELVRRRTRNNGIAAVLFAFLAFNPVVWNNSLARVIREALYVSLSLALVSGLVMLVFSGAPSQTLLGRRRLAIARIAA
ncbi:MAG: hypothetical protein WCC04_01770 [Terriglobales bacterium]